ncbi:MAG: M3 family oligoendopeptidase [Lachnospiraceae bacterium]|nr:M3 family oligoendopeptidase [Lachnospiraceae bacterium]MDY5742873.1 M3 family oligoendopeptidase [Lachnospiraceae bacterium]
MKFSEMPYVRVDMEKLTEQYNDLTARFAAAKSGEEQWEIHQEQYALNKDVKTSMTLAHIRHSIDTTDTFYKAEKDFLDENEPKLAELETRYQKQLLESPYRAYLEEKIGPVAFKSMEIAKKAFDPKLIPLMQEENALVTRYMSLLASAKIEWQGETLNLSLMRPYMIDADRSVRKEAYRKALAFFEENEEKLDDIYDQLVKNRTAQAKLLGMENYIELGYYRMNRNSYSRAEVERFRKQVKEIWVPFVTKIHEQRRQRIGVEKLTYYDAGVYFDYGNPAPQQDPAGIMELGQKMYAELSPETKEFFDFMMENELFDVLGRKTKRSGGYMTYLPNYQAPFIFANFNGTAGDIDVITHECGHAFQGFVSGKDPILEHAEITMETAEIHSMAMEFFTNDWMHLFFGEKAADFLKMQAEDSAIFIPYGTMVDEFQHIVYEKPDMTPAERKAVWAKLEKEYRPGIDDSENDYLARGGFWQKQQHIYVNPFYYIDYCLAQSCALQYKMRMKEDFRRAWESYLKLCELSAKKFYQPMLAEVGLKCPFDADCLKTLRQGLEPVLLS